MALFGLISALAGPSTSIAHGVAHARFTEPHGGHGLSAHHHDDSGHAENARRSPVVSLTTADRDHDHPLLDTGPTAKPLPGPAIHQTFAAERLPALEARVLRSPVHNEIRGHDPPSEPPPRLRAPPLH